LEQKPDPPKIALTFLFFEGTMEFVDKYTSFQLINKARLKRASKEVSKF
jgi:hypothetical protein